MNNIINDQNSELAITYLKAMRVSYTKAKNTNILNTLNLIFAIFSTIVFIIFNKSIADEIKTIIAAIVILGSLILNGFEKNHTFTAARIQEMFDCMLFKIQWNNLLCKEKVPLEKIIILASKYTNNDLSNWYSTEIDESIDQNISSVLCQTTNLYWDVELRKRYNILQTIILGVYFLCVITSLIVKNLTLIESILIFLPTIAVFISFFTTIRDNKSQIDEKVDLRERIDSILCKDVMNDISRDDIRSLQNNIFILRKCNIKIPDWYHRKNRDKFEEIFDNSIRLKKIELGL